MLQVASMRPSKDRKVSPRGFHGVFKAARNGLREGASTTVYELIKLPDRLCGEASVRASTCCHLRRLPLNGVAHNGLRQSDWTTVRRLIKLNNNSTNLHKLHE